MYMDKYTSTSKSNGLWDRLALTVLILLLVTSCVGGVPSGRAFEYGGMYSPSSNTVDGDWALWGHNLGKLFGGKIPLSVQAVVGGQHDEEQLCFSSLLLYKTLENYVLENYGEGSNRTHVRFVVMPNDNKKVCLCAECVKRGNSAANASPAVCALVSKLAQRFPHHLFFTSAYLTTKLPPTVGLPKNTGVIVSAMNLPMRDEKFINKQKTTFSSLVGQWQRVTGRVYVWDYVRNFDDYLTPYPCLTLLQQRLRFYHDVGVKGVFFNGSGYDYATFEDMQTYVEKRLLINPKEGIDTLVARFFNTRYPITGRYLTDYYLQLESLSVARGKVLPFYGGINDAVSYGLSPDGFAIFLSKLDKMSKQITGDERKRLNKLLTGLQFTQLELLRRTRFMYDENKTIDPLESLRGNTWFADMTNYREAKGQLSEYIKEWESLKSLSALRSGKLHNVRLEGKHSLKQLTDGIVGFVSDYHTAWQLFSEKELSIIIPSQSFSDGDVLLVSLLNAPLWHILLPSKIGLWQDGRKLSDTMPKVETTVMYSRCIVKISMDKINTEKPIELRIKCGKGKEMALDEIALQPKEGGEE